MVLPSSFNVHPRGPACHSRIDMVEQPADRPSTSTAEARWQALQAMTAMHQAGVEVLGRPEPHWPPLCFGVLQRALQGTCCTGTAGTVQEDQSDGQLEVRRSRLRSFKATAAMATRASPPAPPPPRTGFSCGVRLGDAEPRGPCGSSHIRCGGERPLNFMGHWNDRM